MPWLTHTLCRFRDPQGSWTQPSHTQQHPQPHVPHNTIDAEVIENDAVATELLARLLPPSCLSLGSPHVSHLHLPGARGTQRWGHASPTNEKAPGTASSSVSLLIKTANPATFPPCTSCSQRRKLLHFDTRAPRCTESWGAIANGHSPAQLLHPGVQGDILHLAAAAEVDARDSLDIVTAQDLLPGIHRQFLETGRGCGE